MSNRITLGLGALLFSLTGAFALAIAQPPKMLDLNASYSPTATPTAVPTGSPTTAPTASPSPVFPVPSPTNPSDPRPTPTGNPSDPKPTPTANPSDPTPSPTVQED